MNNAFPEKPVTNSEADEFSFLSELDLYKLAFILHRSFKVIIAFLVIAIAGAIIFLRYTKKVYSARTAIQIEVENRSKVLGTAFSSPENDNSELVKQVEFLKSEIIYNRVIKVANLRVNYYAEGTFTNSEFYRYSPILVTIENEGSDIPSGLDARIKINDSQTFTLYQGSKEKNVYNFGERITVADLTFKIFLTEFFHEDNIGKFYIFSASTNKKLERYLSRNLKVKINNALASKLGLSFTDYNKDKAVAILEAINQVYLIEGISAKNKIFDQSLAYLSEQLMVTEDTLSKYEEIIANLSRMAEIPEFNSRRDFTGYLRQLNENARTHEYNLNQLSRLEAFFLTDSSETFLIGIASIIEDGRLIELLEKLGFERLEFERVNSAYKPTTESWQERQKRIAFLKRQITEYILLRKDFIDIQLKELRGSMSNLEKDFFEYQPEDSRILKYQRISRRYAEYIDLIRNKQIAINITKSGTVPNFKILSKPSASDVPVYPILYLTYISFLSVWLFVSIIFIVLHYFLQNKITGPGQLEKKIKAPVLGIIPNYTKDKMEFSRLIVGENPKAAISESFRSIRTNLDFILASGNHRVISVTSTVSGEGKTFISLNLSGVIALSGVRVVILDLDMRKPKLHVGLNLDNAEGLSSVLIGKETIDNVIRTTGIPSLSFISAGPAPPNPAELLMSDIFNNLIDELKEKFDVVVMDMPPVGVVTDGLVAMRKATLPIYVLRSEHSKVGFIKNVNRLYYENRFKNISVVLNGVRTSGLYGYDYYSYGYSYGYGYGYGYSSHKDSGGFSEEKKKKRGLSSLFTNN